MKKLFTLKEFEDAAGCWRKLENKDKLINLMNNIQINNIAKNKRCELPLN